MVTLSPVGAQGKPPKRAEVIVHQLEALILEGALKAGDRLPSERALVAQLGVSRASLREAIQQLAARGLLVSQQGGGTYVTNRLEAVFSDPWQPLLSAHPHVRRDVLEFRRTLEGAMAECAAQRATEADRARLAVLLAELETAFAGEDLLALSRTDVAFHQAIAEAAHNVLFAHLSASLLTMLKAHVRDNIANLFAVAPVSAQLLAQHRAIWRAIQARDPAAARAAAEAHIDFVDDTLNAMQAKQGRGGVCWSGGRCSEISGKAQKGAGRESAHVALEK